MAVNSLGRLGVDDSRGCGVTQQWGHDALRLQGPSSQTRDVDVIWCRARIRRQPCGRSPEQPIGAYRVLS
jgi:hypothetical protein